LNGSVWHSAVFEIGAHCLRELPRATGATEATRHMWQPRSPTGSLADTGSCNRPTTLRPATDSDVATSQLNGNATIRGRAAASPAVTLANYVYQCAAKRESSSSNHCASSSSSKDLATSIETFQLEQQMSVL
ncbi:hypothetical protein KR044_008310, partial [Drosophila immigrans]